MISLRARIVRFVSKQIFKRVQPDSDVVKVRRLFERVESRKKMARGVSKQAVSIEGVHCEWLIPEGCQGNESAPVLFYLHGGAYLMGSPGTHRKMVSHIASRCGVRALLPDYALAPEHMFPAGLNDCLKVYRHLLASGVRAEKIIIGGDSAGGGLSMATLLSLRDAGDPLPALAVLLSPWLDLTAQGESARTRADKDPWFRVDEMVDVALRYCTQEQLTTPLVSPVFADVAGLPPMLVQVGDHEILLSDSTRLTDKVTAAGGEVTLQVWPEMWHVFQFFIGQMPESRRAIEDIASYVRQKMQLESAAQ